MCREVGGYNHVVDESLKRDFSKDERYFPFGYTPGHLTRDDFEAALQKAQQAGNPGTAKEPDAIRILNGAGFGCSDWQHGPYRFLIDERLEVLWQGFTTDHLAKEFGDFRRDHGKREDAKMLRLAGSSD